jgi:indolepyruvate ferredoxin oxidoreductase
VAPDFKRALASMFEPGYRLIYHLAPPVLARRDPVSGHPRKMKFGALTGILFQVLAPLKVLRGTPWDIFGWTQERRMERRLIVEYERMIQDVLEQLTLENHAIAVELARLPQDIRGYGHVKLASVQAVAGKQAKLLQSFAQANARAYTAA